MAAGLKASAQSDSILYTVHGTVLDSLSRKPVAWVSVSIKTTSNKMVRSGITDSIGHFRLENLPSGFYHLALSSMAYHTKIIPLHLREVQKQEITLGILQLLPKAKALDKVEVTSTKPLIRQESDRLIYDLQADPDSKGSNLLDMMRKVPFISLDAEQQMRLKNSTSFKLFINGKPSAMLDNNPREVLRSIPASTIQKIEVITNPPAKYDAEGLAGIVNIITNKKTEEGFKGSLNLNGSFPIEGPGAGTSFTVKANELTAAVFAGGSLSSIPTTERAMERNSTGSAITHLTEMGKQRSKGGSGYFGADVSYELNKLQLLSAQLNINSYKNKAFFTQQSRLIDLAGIAQTYQLQNNGERSGSGLDVAFNYEKAFNEKKNKLLTFSYRYAAYQNENTNSLYFIETVNYPLTDFLQENESKLTEHTLQGDYIATFKKWELESGVKVIFRSNSSDYAYRSEESSTNSFRQPQDVIAGYTSATIKRKKWSAKGGLRLEQTFMNGLVRQNYLHLIPSLSFGLQLQDKHSMNFGFSQRLRRPGINRLNPFVDRSDPNYASSGNPQLRPAVMHNILLGYNKSGKLNINLGMGYSIVNNLDFRIYAYDTVSNITHSTFANIGKGNALSTDLYLGFEATKKLSMSLNGNLTYINIKSTENSYLEMNDWFFNVTASSICRINPSWKLSAYLNVIGPNTVAKSFQSRTKTQYNTAISVGYALIKEKLDLSLVINNPATKYRNLMTTTLGPDFNEVSTDQRYLRSFRISVNYNFGQLKSSVKKVKRSIQNNDLSN